MSIPINTEIFDSELDERDIDVYEFEKIYQEYCNQGMWIEYESQFDTDTDTDNTKSINTYRYKSLTGELNERRPKKSHDLSYEAKAYSVDKNPSCN